MSTGVDPLQCENGCTSNTKSKNESNLTNNYSKFNASEQINNYEPTQCGEVFDALSSYTFNRVSYLQW